MHQGATRPLVGFSNARCFDLLSLRLTGKGRTGTYRSLYIGRNRCLAGSAGGFRTDARRLARRQGRRWPLRPSGNGRGLNLRYRRSEGSQTKTLWTSSVAPSGRCVRSALSSRQDRNECAVLKPSFGPNRCNAPCPVGVERNPHHQGRGLWPEGRRKGRAKPRSLRPGPDQPMAAAFTSASMKGTYWAKFFENISTSFAACAS